MKESIPQPDFEKYFKEYAPGVYREGEFQRPRRTGFWTGVPAFLGLMRSDIAGTNDPILLTNWKQFQDYIAGKQVSDCPLAYAARGFFENGGHRCYVVLLNDGSLNSLQDGLEVIAKLNTIDLVCAPDIVRQRPEAFGL